MNKLANKLGVFMSNEQKGRILHHTVAVELTEEMVNQVGGGYTDGTSIYYSTDTGTECRSDSAADC